MGNSNEDRVYQKDALEFVTVAAEYCNLLETLDEYSRKRFISIMQKLLSLLYLKAMQLDEVEPFYDDPIEKFLTEEDWIAIKNKVSFRLGAFDSFVFVNEPIALLENEETNVALSECFADIYQDLSDFVQLYRNGSVEVMNDALWECRQNFQQIWGPRLLSIMQAFHNILFGGKDIDSEEWDRADDSNYTNTNPYVW